MKEERLRGRGVEGRKVEGTHTSENKQTNNNVYLAVAIGWAGPAGRLRHGKYKGQIKGGICVDRVHSEMK